MKSFKRLFLILLLVTLYINGKSQAWIPLSTFPNYTESKYLKSMDDFLYVSSYNPTPREAFISRWNGSFWYQYPNISNANEWANYEFLNDTMYAAYFGTGPSLQFKRLDGKTWTNLFIPVNYSYNTTTKIDLVNINNELYLSGDFKVIAGTKSSVIKYKNGVTSFPGPSSNPGVIGQVKMVSKYNNKILISGSGFLKPNSDTTLASKNLLWDGTSWTKFNNALDSNEVFFNENDTLYTLKDTTGTQGTKIIYRFFNNSFKRINYNMVITSALTLISNYGDCYFYGIVFGNQGLYHLNGTSWVSVKDGFDYGRNLMTFHNNELHAGYNNAVNIQRLSNVFSVINGNIFRDLNSNCNRESSEQGLNNSRRVYISPDNNTATIDMYGNYSIAVSPGTKTITHQRVFGSKYLRPSPCSSLSKTITVVSDSTYTVNFPVIDSTNVTDVSIKIATRGGHRIRKSGPEWVNVIVSNNGTKTVSGEAKLQLPSIITVSSANPSYTSINNNVITWNYYNLGPDSVLKYWVYFSVDTSAVIDDSVSYYTWVTPMPDADTTDNIDSLKCRIVGSYDPNDKQSFPNFELYSNTTKIDYTICFQNTGTADAVNIYVVDTLDTGLPMDKIEILSWSTPKRPKVEVREGRILVFTFANIWLPDSHSNEPMSHGFIRYRCGLYKNMQIGAKIQNRADIYFDYNAAVATNSTMNIRTDKSGINSRNVTRMNDDIVLYPNPANDIINIVSETVGIFNISITDLTGKVVISHYLNGIKSASFSTVGLSDGVYFVKLENDEESIVKKIIIRH